jgi:hypothetical protein
MTFLGVLFIPASLLCFLWQPFYLLPLLVISSIFEAAAVFNSDLGNFNFGITPFYFVELFIFLRLVMLAFGSEKIFPRKDARLRVIVVLLCIFWAWSFISAFVLPRAFAGIQVTAPRSDADEFVPLEWSLSNLAQAGYLTLNCCTLMYAITVVRSRKQTEQLMKALYWAIFIVVFVGFAQFVADKLGLDFPYELFNNNVGYGQATGQEVGTLHRINSTFMEPSMAGSFLATAFCGLAAGLLSKKLEILSLLACLVVLVALLLTTSSTGMVSLAIGVLMLAVYFNPFRSRHPHKSSLSFWIGLAVLAVIGYFVLSNTDLGDALVAMTVDKTETYSFWSRLAKELQALLICANTYGLGVGLGSNRSSGLLPTMLSTVGVVGTSLFAVVLYRISKLFSRTSKSKSLQIAFWALVTMIVSEIVAVPDISRPTLWCLLTIVLTQLNTSRGFVPAPAPAKSGRLVPAPAGLRGSWQPATRGMTK